MVVLGGACLCGCRFVFVVVVVNEERKRLPVVVPRLLTSRKRINSAKGDGSVSSTILILTS